MLALTGPEWVESLQKAQGSQYRPAPLRPAIGAFGPFWAASARVLNLAGRGSIQSATAAG